MSKQGEPVVLVEIHERDGNGVGYIRSKPISVSRALELGLITPEELDQAQPLSDAHNRILASEIGPRKSDLGQKRAKKLSVHLQFSTAVERFRDRWGIVPRLPAPNIRYEELFPDAILKQWVFGSEPSQEQWQRFNQELDAALRIPFGLDRSSDRGLIVAAVCFGLTPDNIIHHWEEIAFTACQPITPGVALVEDWGSAALLRGFSLLVLALLRTLFDLGHNAEALPDTLRRWVKRALAIFEPDGTYPNDEGIIVCLEQLEDYVTNPPREDVKLYLQVGPDTRLSDIQRVWPAVEFRQRQLWGEAPRQPRVWRTYERDAYIYLATQREKLTYEKAFDRWLKINPDDDVEITAVIKSIQRNIVQDTNFPT